MIIVYGLRNCDSCRRALTWLTELKIEYRFVDLHKNVLETSTLAIWIKDVGWEKLLNRRSSTWRQLSNHKKNGLNAENAKRLMLEFPTLIKRPIIETNEQILIGFKEEEKEQLRGRQ